MLRPSRRSRQFCLFNTLQARVQGGALCPGLAPARPRPAQAGPECDGGWSLCEGRLEGPAPRLYWRPVPLIGCLRDGSHTPLPPPRPSALPLMCSGHISGSVDLGCNIHGSGWQGPLPDASQTPAVGFLRRASSPPLRFQNLKKIPGIIFPEVTKNGVEYASIYMCVNALGRGANTWSRGLFVYLFYTIFMGRLNFVPVCSTENVPCLTSLDRRCPGRSPVPPRSHVAATADRNRLEWPRSST